jgi:hypothetical protein
VYPSHRLGFEFRCVGGISSISAKLTEKALILMEYRHCSQANRRLVTAVSLVPISPLYREMFRRERYIVTHEGSGMTLNWCIYKEARPPSGHMEYLPSDLCYPTQSNLPSLLSTKRCHPTRIGMGLSWSPLRTHPQGTESQLKKTLDGSSPCSTTYYLTSRRTAGY